MRNRVIGIIVLVVLLGGGLVAVNNFAGTGARATATPQAIQAKSTAARVVSAEGILVPPQRATLGFKIGGRVIEIPVREGDVVKAGAVLARLDDSQLKAQVAQAETAYVAAQAQLARVKAANAAQIQIAAAQLARLKAGASPQEIAVAAARVQQAATAFAQAQDTYDRLSWVGGPTEVNLRSAVDSAGAALRTAQLELERVKAGARAEDIAVAQAQLDLLQGEAGKTEIRAAEAQVEQAKTALELAKLMAQDALLVAPFDGTVATVNVDVGQVVAPGAPAFLIGNTSKLQVETTDLGEADVGQVAIGQKATVTVDAFEDKTFAGQVTRISAIANDNRGDKVFKVTVELTDALGLRWGMTANVEIAVAK